MTALNERQRAFLEPLRFHRAIPRGQSPYRHDERGPNGRRLCRWCGTEVPTARRSWCGQACVDEYLIRKAGSDARRAVFARDQGVCGECGLDTGRIKRLLYRLKGGYLHNPGDGRLYGAGVADQVRQSLREHWHQRWKRLRERLKEAGFTAGQSLWEMDHVVPVVEGGGCCGLDGLRTLCQPCHRRATRELAARRAKARRAEGMIGA